jgi:hypothetical protein
VSGPPRHIGTGIAVGGHGPGGRSVSAGVWLAADRCRRLASDRRRRRCSKARRGRTSTQAQVRQEALIGRRDAVMPAWPSAHPAVRRHGALGRGQSRPGAPQDRTAPRAGPGVRIRSPTHTQPIGKALAIGGRPGFDYLHVRPTAQPCANAATVTIGLASLTTVSREFALARPTRTKRRPTGERASVSEQPRRHNAGKALPTARCPGSACVDVPSTQPSGDLATRRAERRTAAGRKPETTSHAGRCTAAGQRWNAWHRAERRTGASPQSKALARAERRTGAGRRPQAMRRAERRTGADRSEGVGPGWNAVLARGRR